MAPSIACLAGEALSGTGEGGPIGSVAFSRPSTPFGPSEAIGLVESENSAYYLVCLCDEKGRRLYPGSINYRATLYALKDLGVRCVVGVSAVGSITHNFNVGDIVLIGDVIDRTTQRPRTFFERSGAGVLRQFPVFCPFLSEVMAECLTAAGHHFHANSTLVVGEGPRLETPAEIRFLTAAGGELVGHHFAPEPFLARELEMCFAGVAYVANYAETGSRYRPFSATDLIGGLTTSSGTERVQRAVAIISDLVQDVSRCVAERSPTCECGRTMRHAVEKFGLGDDWRGWFTSTPDLPGRYVKVPPRPSPVTENEPAALDPPV